MPFGCYQVLGKLHLRFSSAAACRRGPRCTSGHRAYFENQEVEFSADGDPETKWCSSTAAEPVQWQIDAGREVRPGHYAFTSAEDVPARDPRTWKLEGSKDGVSWSLLDEHNDEPVFERRHQQKDLRAAATCLVPLFPLHFPAQSRSRTFSGRRDQHRGGGNTQRGKPLGAEKYRRELDLATATARVEYERDGVRFERTHLVSAPDQVFVSRLTASRRGALSFEVSLDRPERFTTTVLRARMSC